MEEEPFYGYDILRHRQQKIVEEIVSKYKDEPVDDDLKKKIWDDLQQAKHEGRVTMPFKVVTRRDIYGKYPEYIEVILDTKV